MIKELFSPGDVLFYDKVNDGISNASHEDAETTIYFNFKQYVPLGVVVDVDEISSSIKLMTIAFSEYDIMNVQNSVDEDILKLMSEAIKSLSKNLNKACGSKQSSVKLYIPNDDDICALVENALPVLRGVETLQHYCGQFLKGHDLISNVVSGNFGYICKKELKIWMGGLAPEIYRFNDPMHYEQERLTSDDFKEKYQIDKTPDAISPIFVETLSKIKETYPILEEIDFRLMPFMMIKID